MEADVAQVRYPASGVRRLEYKPPLVGTWRRISGLGDAFVARGSWRAAREFLMSLHSNVEHRTVNGER